MKTSSFLKVPATALLVFSLASCGGGGDGEGSVAANNAALANAEGQAADNAAQTNAEGQAAGNDSFLSRVIALVQSMSETAEPDNIDSITVTTPETSEPQPIS